MDKNTLLPLSIARNHNQEAIVEMLNDATSDWLENHQPHSQIAIYNLCQAFLFRTGIDKIGYERLKLNIDESFNAVYLYNLMKS